MASFSYQTHYEILGITQQAQLKEIREAYRKLALKCHPDKDPHNPRAVATFQKLGTAYETLADENCRTIYDATLRSRQTPTQPPQPASRAHQRSHDHDWQARREDTSYWSGPTFTHGAPDRNEWGKQWDQEQKDGFDMHEGRHRERTAHREARKQAERKKRDMNQPPPTQDSFDQDAKIFKARAEKLRQREEARQREQWLAELLILLSKIMSIEVDIDEIEAKVDETKRPTKGEKEDEDHEQIFHLPIKRKSLERHLQERVDEYKLIVKLLRDQGLEQEANEADVKLREARKKVTRDERASRKGSSQGEQDGSPTKAKRKGQAEKAQWKPPADNESSLPSPKYTTSQPSEHSRAQRSNTKRQSTSELPSHDRHNFEDTTEEQEASRGYMNNPGVSYDGSDPDQGFTEYTPESSVACNDYDYDDEDYDPPFCNDFHDSHMEAHREFWDIIDDWHECNFCHRISTVMRCPRCDVQACAYCKDKHG